MSPRFLAALALATLVLAACSRVTPENYERVEAGMKREDVHAILGQPDEVSGGGFGGLSVSTETWKGRKHVVQVSYGGDTVVIKHIDAVQP
ncbi:hypothetical protein C3942_11910 [Solimonas fluminis]|uniref:Lipoprotein SmpA/OmlA domain-containing protein n=1 Tax=Solimonas fluminis TaxID=2086571 RepID=A0A2S5TEV2_9GAMM|nr:hypothetical protein [Solimonas fluminis]PPE73505.1 hypothetical protein C3942_11910 [Solimonas fluminis]